MCSANNDSVSNPIVATLPHYYILALFFLILSGCSDKPSQSWVQADYGLYDGHLSENGTLAIVATVDHNALLWDLSEGKLKQTWQHQESDQTPIILVRLSRDGRTALTAEHQAFAIWDTQTGKTLGYWKLADQINDITLSNDASVALVGLKNKSAQLINLTLGNTIRSFAHLGQVNTIALSLNNQYAVTGSDDRQVRIWNVTNGELLRSFKMKDSINQVAISPDNKTIFASAGQFQAVFYDVDSDKITHTLKLRGWLSHALKPANMTVSATLFSDDGQWLYTASPPQFLRQWSVATGELEHTWTLPRRNFWKPPGSIITDIAINPENRTIITEGSDGMAHAWPLP